MKAPERYWDFQKEISGCGVFGVLHKKRGLIGGQMPIDAMCTMHDRGNGLGGGFAAYGIYPDMAHCYALHMMCDDTEGLDRAEQVIKVFFNIEESQPIPTRKTKVVQDPPVVWRFFVTPKADRPKWKDLSEEDYMVNVVMHINTDIPGAHVISSGKNMGAFKGVGFPEDIAEFFKLEQYKAYIWTGHNRFPTNTPGRWVSAHPFTLLDWAIVHNGEISSYGINRRYLAQHDYICTMHTDTEVVAYLLDMLTRKHKLDLKMVSAVFAPPFWDEIDRMPEEQQKAYNALRMIYGPGMLNGPFAILVTNGTTMMGLNDRVKLRPLLVAEKDDMVFMSSEESSIREVQRDLDKVWAPKAGEPVFAYTDDAEEVAGAASSSEPVEVTT